MADSGSSSPSVILHELDDAFNSISVSLGCVDDALAQLQRVQEHYELQFDSEGQFKGMRSKYFPDDLIEPDDYRSIEVAGNCEHLPTWVNEVWKAEKEAKAAIANLPQFVKERLTHHVDRPWVAMVRQECLNTLLVWPGERIYTRAAEKLVSNVPTLLKQAEKRDPHETWRFYLERLDVYRSNVIAIRDDVLPDEAEPAELREIPTSQLHDPLATGDDGAGGNEDQNNRQQPGPKVSDEENENRKLVAGRWETFKRDYRKHNFTQSTYCYAAKWMTDTFDDMPFLTEGLADPTDYDQIGNSIKAMVRAYKETPEPKSVP